MYAGEIEGTWLNRELDIDLDELQIDLDEDEDDIRLQDAASENEVSPSSCSYREREREEDLEGYRQEVEDEMDARFLSLPTGTPYRDAGT